MANVFHAGDGNLHPLILYSLDQPRCRACTSVKELGAAILQVCLDAGGSISGSTGSGRTSAATSTGCSARTTWKRWELLRAAFDPDNRANPGKVLPTPRTCGESAKRRGQILPAGVEVY